MFHGRFVNRNLSMLLIAHISLNKFETIDLNCRNRPTIDEHLNQIYHCNCSIMLASSFHFESHLKWYADYPQKSRKGKQTGKVTVKFGSSEASNSLHYLLFHVAFCAITLSRSCLAIIHYYLFSLFRDRLRFFLCSDTKQHEYFIIIF